MDDPEQKDRPQTAKEGSCSSALKTGHKKKAPRSAALLSAVPPMEQGSKFKGRTTASATSQRVSISPPVCGVHPGKVLELRTNLALMRAKAILEQQQQKEDDEEEDQKMRGRLKSARLQPLGMVSGHTITEDECLGVVPVCSRGSKPYNRQRPRSSTTPGVHFDLPGPESPEEGRVKVGRKVKPKRRSYSAVSARAVDTHQLLKFLSVSRQTGLVPQKSISLENCVKAALSNPSKQEPSPSDRVRTLLPPVIQDDGIGMKIEVKGLRRMSEDGPSLSTPRQPSEPQEAPEASTKLPPITASPSATKKESLSNSKSNTQNQNCSANSSTPFSNSTQPSVTTSNTETKVHTANTNMSPRKVTIVSIGEAEVVEERQKSSKSHKHKRHPGSSQTGRLSLGWSRTRPIEPLKGNSLPVPHPNTRTWDYSAGKSSTRSKNEGEMGRQSGAEGSEMERVLSPNNLLIVDVNEFLSDDVLDATQ